MSHRIFKERARQLRERELELQQMQKDGIPLPKSNRRHKKYLLQVKKQKGYIAYLKERYKSTKALNEKALVKKLDENL